MITELLAKDENTFPIPCKLQNVISVVLIKVYNQSSSTKSLSNIVQVQKGTGTSHITDPGYVSFLLE